MLFSWLEDAARQRPSARALVQGEVYLSYRGLLHRVDRRATELRALGLREGDWVGLMLGNAVEFVVLTAALDLLGAVTVPLNPAVTNHELQDLMKITPLRVVISHPRSGGPRDSGSKHGGSKRPAERRRLRGTLLQVSLYGDQPYDVELPVNPQAAFAAAGPEGSMRVVLRTAENLAAEAENLALALEFKGDDRVVSSVPLHTPEGFQVAMLLPMGYGGMLYLEDNMAPRNLVRLVRQGGLSLLPMWPGVLAGLSRYAALGVPWPKDRPIRVLTFRPTGTAAVQLPHPAISGLKVSRALHLPEAGTVCIDDGSGGSPAVVGRPVPGVQIQVSGPSTAKAKRTTRGKKKTRAKAAGATRRQGLLMVKGSSVSQFRIDSDQERPVRLTDKAGWLDTGCRVRQDKNGRVTLLGRQDDLMELEGSWISLHEVGEAMMSHPAVDEVELAVDQAPDSGEPVLAARVETGEKLDPAELMRHVSRSLSPYKVPAKVEVIRSRR